MYNPTLQEVEAVSRRCFKLRWANIRPANWSTSPVIGSVRFHDMMTSLADAVRAAFPLRVCWPEIHNTKQKEGELAADYRTRMESVFAAHSGIDAQNEAYDDLLKTALINGLHPSLKDRVMATCVGWETGTIANVWTHVLHAERNKVLTNEMTSLHRSLLPFPGHLSDMIYDCIAYLFKALNGQDLDYIHELPFLYEPDRCQRSSRRALPYIVW
ncbi:hypothetical protein JOB18_016606 [Solea senegalensis]|uniref:Uncharacterized protein n=1 Tax=Solea senegalensis TaxID=28829 RepID=A0AAV6Q3Z4_SOLSE|nr:hypothetical protein JOB18_016606 [Solea senegalensis]